MSTPSRDDWPDKCPNCGCDGSDKEDDPLIWIDDGTCCACGEHPWKWELEQAKERIKVLEGVIQKGTEGIDSTVSSLEYAAPELHPELRGRILYRTAWMRGAFPVDPEGVPIPKTYEDAVNYLAECCDWTREDINGWSDEMLTVEAQQCWRSVNQNG